MAKGQLPRGSTTFEVILSSGAAASVIDRVLLEEDQTAGQLIIDFTVEAQIADGSWQSFAAGTTVGAKRIIVVASPVAATRLRVTVTSGFAKPTGLALSAFAPSACALKPFEYDATPSVGL